MRITKKTILAIGLIASSLTLNSCDYNDNNEVLRRPTALVTVYPSAPDGFFMQLDESTSLVPTNMKASPFGDKKSEGFGELYNRRTRLRRQPTACVCKLD